MTDKSILPIAVRPLPNGSVLYHIGNQSKLTRIQAVMRTGSIHEGDDAGCGLSHFLEHMLFQGCERYPDNQASDRIHQLGGDSNAYTTFDHTAYYVEVPVEKFSEAADVITSMISAPLFPEHKFITEKQVIAREADMIFDRPVHQLIQQLWQGLYSVHPARMPIIGFPDKIAAVTRDTMYNYYQRRYGAMRCHWLVTGALNTDMVQAVLSEKLSGFTRGNLAEVELPHEPEALFEIRKTTEFHDPLTRIALGIRTPEAANAVTPVLDLLAGIIGGSDSSLLPRRFLYQDQLALAIDADFDATSFGCVLAVSAACEPGKAAALEQGIRSELALVRKRGVTSQELQREKLQQRLTIYQQLKNTSTITGVVNSLRMNFGCAEGLEQYLHMLDAVTLDEINAVAEDYLNPRRFVWSLVTPQKESSSCFMPEAADAGPQIHSGELPNGSKYILLERTHIPMDSLSVLLPAGPIWENNVPHGSSQLLSKLLATGPDDLPEEEFYALLDDAGIDLDVSCGNNTLSMEMSFPPAARGIALDMFSRILAAPRRDAQVFNRVRSNLIEQLQSKLMEPNFAAAQRAKRLVFGNHPAGNSRFGSVEDLQSVELDTLLDFYASRWDKNLVNLGSTIPPDDPDEVAAAIDMLNQLSTDICWSCKELTKPQPAALEELNIIDHSHPYLVPLPREQSTVVCALPGGFAHKLEYYALLIMDSALNGLSSNLFKEIREKRSLAYSTGAAVNCGLVQGLIMLHAGVKPENAFKALECLQAEVARLATCGLSPEEFASARLAALSALARQLESPDTQLLHAQLSLFYGDDPLQSLNCAEKMRNISLTECNQILKRIFSASPAVCVIAGNVQTQS